VRPGQAQARPRPPETRRLCRVPFQPRSCRAPRRTAGERSEVSTRYRSSTPSLMNADEPTAGDASARPPTSSVAQRWVVRAIIAGAACWYAWHAVVHGGDRPMFEAFLRPVALLPYPTASVAL